MTLLIAGLLTGFLLALPTGPGAFAVIRTAMAENGGFKKGLKIAMAPIIADLFWVSLALYAKSILLATQHTNHFIYKFIGVILILVAILIALFGHKEKTVTFTTTFFAVIPNATIAITASFILSSVFGPDYAQLGTLKKVLLEMIIICADFISWMIIIACARKLNRFSATFLSVAYSILIGTAGVILIAKQFF